MNKKIFGVFISIFVVFFLATPVRAIGPTNAEGKNPWVVVHNDAVNTQMWLPSGVMNEWVNNPALPGPTRLTIKDAAKFQINEAIVIDSPVDLGLLFANENQWFYLTQAVFAAMLIGLGGNPAVADPYDAGIYIKIVQVGW